ncbi:hypothetical protein N7931_06495 [Catenovulum sp. 2E275]|uniref:hypothetical protein n=1 Tax=Catenovulum sp. 2E275 TaxID=2980497 RepID=UPI0021D3CF69|nr:hypothetical protein [Catenovulum sp. 2E275]MCU4675280.1 hypothetical protein [Catenovulum sp. 2E275]
MKHLIFSCVVLFLLAACQSEEKPTEQPISAKSATENTTSNQSADTKTRAANQSEKNNENIAAQTDFLKNQTYTRDDVLYNESAYIPAQCYVKTQDELGKTYNTCFACHGQAIRPNHFNDVDLQLEYGFTAEYTQTNRWKNLFRDFSTKTAQISAQEIKQYIKQSNYFDENGNIMVKQRLTELADKAWDANQNGQWDGFIPDAYFNFDNQGFDRTPDNTYTGWRAFAYAPLPGSFLPTNGQTGDVLIRLPKVFRLNDKGEFDAQVYKINLAVVEAMIKEQDLKIETVDEQLYQVDLDKNGQLTQTDTIKYQWAPNQNIFMSYVGQAKTAFNRGEIKMAARLYPVGTEFLHTLRYIDYTQNSGLQLANRMKEIRYSQKSNWNNYGQLQNAGLGEIKEKHDFPDRLRQFRGDAEQGLQTGLGWKMQGFIEDKQGDLRPQTYEETVFCMGCHSGISAVTDNAFAYSRKYNDNQFNLGWYHWSQKDFVGTIERKLSNGDNEYTTYLKHNGGFADEYRVNDESKTVSEKLAQTNYNDLHNNIDLLLKPSQQRASQLNKTYKTIVEEQSYIWGRTPLLKPATNNMHEFIKNGTPTGLEVVLR